MNTMVTYTNGRTLPRSPHQWLASAEDTPCRDCGADVGEVHRRLGCTLELCPQCGEFWMHCSCKTVDEIPDHGRFAWRYPWLTIEHLEDAEGRPYEMRVEEEAE